MPAGVRSRGFRAYPLHSIPRGWSVDPHVLQAATSSKRIKENLVRQLRAGVSSACVAIFAGGAGPYVHLRLAKLTEDAIERLDTATGQEELIEAKEGQYFAESVHFVVNTSNGLAMGEYRPNSLSVLGKWPGVMLSAALASLGTVESTAAQPVTFQPYPTVDFLQRAIGRAVQKFQLKMGPISPETSERAGVSSEVVEELSLEGNIMSFDLEMGIAPKAPLDDGAVQKLAGLAGRLSEFGAKKLLVTLEDREAFDLLNDNLVYYRTGVDLPRDSPRNELRIRVLAELRSLLVQHEADLLKLLG
ncbi:MAG: hypothetical protein L3K00_03170 [Thermoplasmata archaeon]|nr:hypothetical protein [Thermoplasmata archaeon]